MRTLVKLHHVPGRKILGLLDYVRSIVRPKAPAGRVPGPSARRSKVEEARPAPAEAAQTLHAGKLQLIGLGEIRAHFGDQWDQVREKAMSIGAKVIRRRLTNVDVFSPVGDDAFVILFVGLDDTNAAFKARVLADEIKAVLCGEIGHNFGLSVSSRVIPLKNTSDIPDVGSKEAFTSWVDRKLQEGDEAAPTRSQPMPTADPGLSSD